MDFISPTLEVNFSPLISPFVGMIYPPNSGGRLIGFSSIYMKLEQSSNHGPAWLSIRVHFAASSSRPCRTEKLVLWDLKQPELDLTGLPKLQHVSSHYFQPAPSMPEPDPIRESWCHAGASDVKPSGPFPTATFHGVGSLFEHTEHFA